MHRNLAYQCKCPFSSKRVVQRMFALQSNHLINSHYTSTNQCRNIAVMDSHTHLPAFPRTNGAKITSINVAMDKAFTSANHRIPTSAYTQNV